MNLLLFFGEGARASGAPSINQQHDVVYFVLIPKDLVRRIQV